MENEKRAASPEEVRVTSIWDDEPNAESSADVETHSQPQQQQQQQQQQKQQPRSPARVARQALQAWTRKLGRADSPNVADRAAAIVSDEANREHSNAASKEGSEDDKVRQRPRESDTSRTVFSRTAPAPAQNSPFPTHSSRSKSSTVTATASRANARTSDAVTSSSARTSQRHRPRTVQPSPPPRGLGTASSRSHTRRRGRATATATPELSHMAAPSRSLAGSGGNITTSSSINNSNSIKRDLIERRRRQHEHHRHVQDASSTASETKRRRLSKRNPVTRYLVLSVVLVTVGLAVRYLWRQLAGLAGALLILTAARRWTGNKGAGTTALSKATTSSARRKPRQVRGTSGSDRPCSPANGAGGTDAVADSTFGTDPESCEEVTVLEAAMTAATATANAAAAAAAAVAAAVVGDTPQTPEWDGAFAGSPPELRKYWEDGGPECNFYVRGPNYMSDKRKIPAGPAVMRLIHVDLFAVDREVFHVASKGRCRERVAAFVKSFEDHGETAPFLFILNILVPGTPVVSTVMYWALERENGDGGEEGSSEGKAGLHLKAFTDMLERYAEVPKSGFKKLDRRRALSISTPSSPMLDEGPWEASHAPLGFGDEALNGIRGGDASDSNRRNKVVELSEGVGQSPAEEDVTGDEMGAGLSLPVPEGAKSAAGVDRLDPRSDPAGLLDPDDFRNQRFKLIPSIVAGPFIVRRAVGNKPALLGRKLNQRYFRESNYVETDVDVGSSMVAEKIVSLCRGYARSLTVEIGICLEGRCKEELPEKCLGVIRLVNLDLEGAEPLEDHVPSTSSPPNEDLSSSLDSKYPMEGTQCEGLGRQTEGRKRDDSTVPERVVESLVTENPQGPSPQL